MAQISFENALPSVIFILLGTSVLYYYFRGNNKPSLPPGPKPLPIIGNIRDLPPQGTPEYKHWLKFKDQYGPLSSITLLGTAIIIIHDREAAHDLLEKTSMKTSARPDLYFANELCGFKVLLPNRQYDSTFRHYRKLVHRQLGTRVAAQRFRDIQDVESHRFLLRALNDPENLIKHIKTEASAIILKLTYGYSIEPHKNDPLVDSIERMMHYFSLAFVPLTWPVDFIPLVRYIPEWFPGGSYKSTARKWKEVMDIVLEMPYDFVKRQMISGTPRPSYVASLLNSRDQEGDKDNNPEEYSDDAIKDTAAVIFAGGADTTVSTLSSFVLAMLLFPRVQEKAREEIDRVVGTHRLPNFEDRDRLPYVNAVIQESFRWLPVVPIGTTHVTEEEILYGGYRIPKGTYLLPSIWWFLHDPQTYADPLSFDPDRYLEPRNEPDPDSEAFGYGRRICPGRFLADESVFLTISRLLATFDIKKAVDEQGKEIVPQVEVTPGLISRPLDFLFRISPRNEKCVNLIKAVEVEHPWEASDASRLNQDLMEG